MLWGCQSLARPLLIELLGVPGSLSREQLDGTLKTGACNALSGSIRAAWRKRRPACSIPPSAPEGVGCHRDVSLAGPGHLGKQGARLSHQLRANPRVAKGQLPFASANGVRANYQASLSSFSMFSTLYGEFNNDLQTSGGTGAPWPR